MPQIFDEYKFKSIFDRLEELKNMGFGKTNLEESVSDKVKAVDMRLQIQEDGSVLYVELPNSKPTRWKQ